MYVTGGDKAAMLGVNQQYKFFSKNLHENQVMGSWWK